MQSKLSCEADWKDWVKRYGDSVPFVVANDSGGEDGPCAQAVFHLSGCSIIKAIRH